MKAGRQLFVCVALVMLATVSAAAAATPLAGPCGPGAAYDPACDVNHDNTIDIADIQLTAGHWNQSGPWVSDNQHTHLGQTWTGTNNTLRLTGSYGAPDYAPLVLSNSATDGAGLRVSSTGGDGAYVSSAADDGVQVWRAGNPSAYWEPATKNGFEVNGAEGFGLYVGRADQAGVLVDSAGGNGFYVGQTGADNDGVYVNSAGDDGLFVAKTGNATAYAGNSNHNGVEIGNTEGHGVYVNSAGFSGVYVDSVGANGLMVHSAGGSGVYVNSTGLSGVFVGLAGLDGVYANTTRPGHDYGFYTPDRIYAGTTLLQSLSLVAQVGGADALTPGDLVAAVGVADPFSGGVTPVPQVRLADGKLAGVVGVVETRLALVQAGELLPAADGSAPIESLPPELHSADGPAQPGDYVAITVLGAAQVKVQDGEAIQPGQRLTISATPGHARALQNKLIEGMMVTEGASVIGVALEAPKGGMVWVLVNPQ